jgi:asparaginyl-tRNA synthetase
MRIKISQLSQADIGKKVTVKGWIKTVRQSKSCSFVDLNDGSNFNGLQIVVDVNLPRYDVLVSQLTTGASMSATGLLVTSPGKEQAFELKAEQIELIGECPAQDYPLQKKHHSLEFLRTIAHLRPRTNTIGAVARVRNSLSYATHRFFQGRGFLYVMTPIITGSDCEGAGQMFQVSTLDYMNMPRTAEGKVDYSKDFFGKPAYLTVSGQLNGETYACALSSIYTFGPTFRAENSNTARHLAEFWMIEPEMAFAELKDNMECAESYIKFCIQAALEECPQDMAFFEHHISPGIIERLEHIVKEPFERVTYTDAVAILEKSHKKFDYPVSWGIDLQSEHERYLVEEYFKKPTILYNYPEKIKAFYMRKNKDGKTVAAMDVLVAGVGEIIGGSQREERYDVLIEKMKNLGLDPAPYWWYLELRKYGSVPHAGFGLGFERLVRLVTGMENIRDVIPFPRFPGSAEF